MNAARGPGQVVLGRVAGHRSDDGAGGLGVEVIDAKGVLADIALTPDDGGRFEMALDYAYLDRFFPGNPIASCFFRVSAAVRTVVDPEHRPADRAEPAL